MNKTYTKYIILLFIIIPSLTSCSSNRDHEIWYHESICYKSYINNIPKYENDIQVIPTHIWNTCTTNTQECFQEHYEEAYINLNICLNSISETMHNDWLMDNHF